MFGILNINKAPERTSRDEVNVVQRLAKPSKVGHAGTLDPMATGVLLVCVGQATKLISLLQEATKTYVAEFQFGQTSDTDDSTGQVTAVKHVKEFTRSEFEAALPKFVGPISQVPPQFSAVKVKGRRAYQKARQGEAVALKAKTVHVHAIDILVFDWPTVVVKIQCGSGTYIRSIVRDLGQNLGCGGLMSALERTAIGQMTAREGIPTEDLNDDALAANLINPLVALEHLVHYRCSAQETEGLKTGRAMTYKLNQVIQPASEKLPERRPTDAPVCLVDMRDQRLLGLAELQSSTNMLQPRNVFVS